MTAHPAQTTFWVNAQTVSARMDQLVLETIISTALQHHLALATMVQSAQEQILTLALLHHAPARMALNAQELTQLHAQYLAPAPVVAHAQTTMFSNAHLLANAHHRCNQ